MCSSREAATFPDVEKRIRTSGMSTRRGEPGYKHIEYRHLHINMLKSSGPEVFYAQYYSPSLLADMDLC